MASGRVGTALKLNVAGLIFTTLLVYVGSRFGALYVAWGIVLESVVTLPLGIRLAGQVSRLGLRQALRSGMPGVLTAGCVYAAIVATDEHVATEPAMYRLLVTGSVGAFSTLAAWWLFAPDFLLTIAQLGRLSEESKVDRSAG